MNTHENLYRHVLSGIASIRSDSSRIKELNEKLDYLTGLKVLMDLDQNPQDPNYDPLITSKFNHLLMSVGLSMTCYEDESDKYSLIAGKECRLLMKEYYKSQINFDLEDAIVEFNIASKECGHE